MNKSRAEKRSPSLLGWLLVILVVVASIIFLTASLYRPDTPIASIVSGSSAQPSFVVQIIRPRAGLPVGGLLPPQWFGVDAELVFDSNSDDSTYTLDDETLELTGSNWKLRLMVDAAGQIQPESEIVFDLTFEDQVRRVRCTPARLPVGIFQKTEIAPDEFSGTFEIQLPDCEDAETGVSLGWPPKPFELRGSFDRLAPKDGPE